jgi:hypothetical protein
VSNDGRWRLVPRSRGTAVLGLVAGLLIIVSTVLVWPGWSVPVKVILMVCAAGLLLASLVGLMSSRRLRND